MINFSKKIVASPNAEAASLAARSIISSASFSFSINLMPLPPPPADALTRRGTPMRLISVKIVFVSFLSTSFFPGAIGTLAFSINSLADVLLPIARIASALGPMKVILFFSHASANKGFSDKNP